MCLHNAPSSSNFEKLSDPLDARGKNSIDGATWPTPHLTTREPLETSHQISGCRELTHVPVVVVGNKVDKVNCTGTTCIKIGLPGKLILGDYFQENMTPRRPLLLLRISFPGRPIFIQLHPGNSSATYAPYSLTGSSLHSKTGSQYYTSSKFRSALPLITPSLRLS